MTWLRVSGFPLQWTGGNHCAHLGQSAFEYVVARGRSIHVCVAVVQNVNWKLDAIRSPCPFSSVNNSGTPHHPPGYHQLRKRQESENPCLPIPLAPTQQNTRTKTNNTKNERAKRCQCNISQLSGKQPNSRERTTTPPQTDHPAPPPWPPFCAWRPRQTRRRPFWRRRRPPRHPRIRHRRRRRRPC